MEGVNEMRRKIIRLMTIVFSAVFMQAGLTYLFVLLLAR